MNMKKFAFTSALLATTVYAIEKTSNIENKSASTFELELECATSIEKIGYIFIAETDDLLTKLPKIYYCGAEYEKKYNSDSYKNCISSLNLSDRYEEAIGNRGSYVFNNAIDFKRSIKVSASHVCADLKTLYGDQNPASPLVVYSSKIKVTLNLRQPPESGSSVFTWLIIVISVLSLLLTAMGAYLVRLKWIDAKSKKAKTEMVDSEEFSETAEDLFAPPAYGNYAPRSSTIDTGK